MTGLLIITFVLYFLPTIVAMCCKLKDLGYIFGINLFFGWTFIGWCVAMIWCFGGKRA
jgi:hypothetical protein